MRHKMAANYDVHSSPGIMVTISRIQITDLPSAYVPSELASF